MDGIKIVEQHTDPVSQAIALAAVMNNLRDAAKQVNNAMNFLVRHHGVTPPDDFRPKEAKQLPSSSVIVTDRQDAE